MAIHRPAIVWMRGPFPASVHDVTIFRGGKADDLEETWDKNSLYFATKKLGGDAKGLADGGYKGEPDTILTWKDGQSPELKEFKARGRAREETLHSRFKGWNILESCFHHGHGTQERMELHGHVMSAIAVITQYDFENGHLPSDVC